MSNAKYQQIKEQFIKDHDPTNADLYIENPRKLHEDRPDLEKDAHDWALDHSEDADALTRNSNAEQRNRDAINSELNKENAWNDFGGGGSGTAGGTSGPTLGLYGGDGNGGQQQQSQSSGAGSNTYKPREDAVPEDTEGPKDSTEEGGDSDDPDKLADTDEQNTGAGTSEGEASADSRESESDEDSPKTPQGEPSTEEDADAAAGEKPKLGLNRVGGGTPNSPLAENANAAKTAANIEKGAELAKAAESVEAAAATTEAAAGLAAFLASPGGLVLSIIIAIICFFIFMFLLQTLAAAFPDSDKCKDDAASTTDNNVIVLDPGHISESNVKDDGTGLDWGGTGASDNGLKEYEVVWDIAKEVESELTTKGYKVVFTRSAKSGTGARMTNKDRAEVGNTNDALLEFRIHNDGTTIDKPGGFFLMYPDREGQINKASGGAGAKGPSKSVQDKSKAASEAILSKIKDPMVAAGMKVGKSGGILTDKENRGAADNNGGVLRGSLFSKVPVSLIEIGNLSSSADATWLKKDANIKKLGKILADGIAAAAPIKEAAAVDTTSSYAFPVGGTKEAFDGRTKSSNQPRAPSNADMIKKTAANSVYQWPIPSVSDKFQDKWLDVGTTVHKTDGEPGFFACRGAKSGRYCRRPHKGVDIYATFGTPIVAPEDGTITKLESKSAKSTKEAAGGGAGRIIIMKGASGNIYTFMHTEGFSDAVLKGAGMGDQFSGERDDIAGTGKNYSKNVSIAVKGGDTIAYVGNTGGIQNPHLHFELGASGSQKDPTSMLNDWLSGKTTTTSGSGECNESSNSSIGEAVVVKAKTQLDKPYVWGGCHDWTDHPDGCSSYDCSGFAGWAWYWGSDKKFSPEGSTAAIRSQMDNTSRYTKQTASTALPGDLVLFDGHVGIYVGDGKMIHAPNHTTVVKIAPITSHGSPVIAYLRPVVK